MSQTLGSLRNWCFVVERSGPRGRNRSHCVGVRARSRAAAIAGLGLHADERARDPSVYERLRNVAWPRSLAPDLADCFHTLGVALRSGHSLLQSFSLVSRQSRNPQLRGVLGDLYLKVSAGTEFAEAMASHPEVFSSSQLALAQAAAKMSLSEAGALFLELGLALRRDQGLRQRFVASLAYPLALLCMAFVAALVLQLKALPPMVELFVSMGVSLPTMTELLYRMAGFMMRHADILALVVGVFLCAFLYGGRQCLRSVWFQHLMLRLPLIGKVARARALSRALSIFILLKQGGASNRDMFGLAAASAGNAGVASFFESAYAHVKRGMPIESAFMEERDILGDDGLRLAGKMELGMAGGDLGTLLRLCMEDMTQQAELRLGLLPKLLEIPMLIFCAAIIGSIILAIFLPYPSLLADLAGRMHH